MKLYGCFTLTWFLVLRIFKKYLKNQNQILYKNSNTNKYEIEHFESSQKHYDEMIWFGF